MSRTKQVTNQLLKDSQVMEARSNDDTIRLWESYRDQATMWRALALLQIPATFIAIVLALIIWQTRSISLNVPARPQPGQYAVQQLHSIEFIEAATEFVNLVASYQPAIATKQFERASEMVMEPLLSRFKMEQLGNELRAIVTTSRSQMFFIDPTRTEVLRTGDEVHVSLVGSRQKIIAGKSLPLLRTRYTITMRTVPRNVVNPLGIVITNMSFEDIRM